MKKLVSASLFLILIPFSAHAIPFEDMNTAVAAQSTTTGATLSGYTNNVGDFLIIGVMFNNNADPTSVTVVTSANPTGVVATKVIGSGINGTDSSWWSLVKPPTGAMSFKVAWTGGTIKDVIARGISFRGAVSVIGNSDLTAMAASSSSMTFTATSSFATSRIYDEKISITNSITAVTVTGTHQTLISANTLNKFSPIYSYVAPVAVGSNTLGYSWSTATTRMYGAWVEVRPLFELWPLDEY